MAAVSTLVIFPSVAQSDVAPILDPNEGWTKPLEAQNSGSMGAIFIDSSNLSRNGISYLTHSGINMSNSVVDPTCASTTDPKCNFDSFAFLATIPTCTSSSDVNCLVEVGAIDSKGVKTAGNFSRYLPDKAQNEYVGNPDWNLPSGVGASLFTIPGVDNPAGNSYLVSVNMGGGGSRIPGKDSISLNEFSATIVPVQLLDISGIFANTGCFNTPRVCNPGINKLIRPDGSVSWGLSGGSGGAGKYSCAGISWGEGICAQKQAFPANYRFYVKVRLTLMPTGWMHGRISDPNISIATSGKISELTVTANPIRVPLVYKRYQWIDMPADLQKLYDPTRGSFIGGGASSSGQLLNEVDARNPLLRATTSTPSPFDSSGMAELLAWLPYAEDKAVAMPSYWSVRALYGRELSSANACFTNPNQLNGIVTTNSTQYSAGPPEFDKTEGFLNYKVASPHFTSSGDVFKGSYDLAMRSDVARCIYGFSKAPVSAKVSVVSADGKPQVATTVFSENDGWVYLKARNFEFSSPSVRVKLEQESVAVKKTTITCVKGKLVKKVTGTAPKCPSGYKKK